MDDETWKTKLLVVKKPQNFFKWMGPGRLLEQCSEPRLVVLYRGLYYPVIFRDYFISHEIRIPSLTKQYFMECQPRAWFTLLTLVFPCYCFWGNLHSLKLTISPLKMDGWNTSLSFWVSAYFQVRWLLVLGRVSKSKPTQNQSTPIKTQGSFRDSESMKHFLVVVLGELKRPRVS